LGTKRGWNEVGEKARVKGGKGKKSLGGKENIIGGAKKGYHRKLLFKGVGVKRGTKKKKILPFTGGRGGDPE